MQLIILGLGREGFSSYQFWRERDAELPIVLVDNLPLEKFGANWKTTLLHDQKTGFVQSENFNTSINDQTVVMVTPGIKPDHPVLNQAINAGAWVSSNMQIFLEICLPDRAKPHPLSALLPKIPAQTKVIGVTGTKGKSTTTAVIYHLLEGAGLPSFLGGNIGKPALDLVPLMLNSTKTQQLFAVLEMSCHQLNRLTISPEIAVIQSITPEHLDYYPNFDQYVLAKTNITQYQQDSDWLIYQKDNSTTNKIAEKSRAQTFCFSLYDQTCAASAKTNKLYYQNLSVIKTDELQLIGQHNWLNVMPGIIVAAKLAVEPLKINQLLKSFSPLPHRLELISQQHGVQFFNDSLSTNPEAAIAALSSFGQQPIILIAGGFDRGLDYSGLAKKIAQSQIKLAILLPETGKRIASLLNKISNHKTIVEFVSNLQQAVALAKTQAQAGDIVLLSPGSASFNQFKDYQDRGNTFKRLVLDS